MRQPRPIDGSQTFQTIPNIERFGVPDVGKSQRWRLVRTSAIRASYGHSSTLADYAGVIREARVSLRVADQPDTTWESWPRWPI